jgi:hypothetical protein
MVTPLKKILKKIYFVTLLLGISLYTSLKESYLRHYTFFCLHLKDMLIHMQGLVNGPCYFVPQKFCEIAIVLYFFLRSPDSENKADAEFYFTATSLFDVI